LTGALPETRPSPAPRPAETPCEVSRDRLRFAPVFVLCTARSYSSVITCMIGQHPQLFAFPELKLFAHRTLGELEASLPRSARERRIRHRSPGLVRAVAELEFGGQDDEALERALRWLRVRGSWTGIEALDFLMERLWPLTAIEKSPETVVEEGALERIAAAYPRARFIHLVRHPVATVLSMSAHLAARLPDYDAAAYGEQCVEAWLASHERISTFAQHSGAKPLITVRAEELLQDPRTHLGRIARSLGLRADVASINAMVHP
jgi:hypothetical protein